MSQGSVILPVTGIHSGLELANDINAALDALRTAHSGSSPPSADTPEEGQFWLDTSNVGGGDLPIVRQYDGTDWVSVWVLDTALHTTWPPSGPIATTTGTGSAYVLDTTPYEPTTTPDKGFSMLVEIHTANAGACTIAVNVVGIKALRSASGVELPAGALVADSIIQISYLPGTNEWIISGFFAGSNPVPPGVISPYSGFTAPSGYLFANGVAVSRATFANLLTAITIAQSGTLISGANTVTGLSDTSEMQVGMPIEGASIPPGTVINTITSATALLLSANATANSTETVTVFPWSNGDGSTTFNTPKINGRTIVGSDTMGTSAANVSQTSTNITTTNNSPSATVASASGLVIGFYIISTNVPYGTTITAINGTTITMSQNATASAGPTAARFSPLADAQTSGAVGGQLSHTLSTPELPVHTHAPSDPGHGHNMNSTAAGQVNQPAVTAGYPVGQSPSSGGNPQCGGTSLSIVSNFTGITIGNAGGGLAHNTASPGIVMKFIVKT